MKERYKESVSKVAEVGERMSKGQKNKTDWSLDLDKIETVKGFGVQVEDSRVHNVETHIDKNSQEVEIIEVTDEVEAVKEEIEVVELVDTVKVSEEEVKEEEKRVEEELSVFKEK